MAALAALLLVAGCGALPKAASAPTPSPIASPSGYVGFDLVVGEKDHAAALRVGQKLLVALQAAKNMTPWSLPQSSDLAILAPTVDPAAMAPIGVTVAAFVALAPGDVQITSTAGPRCESGQACPMLAMYAILYSLQVSVSA